METIRRHWPELSLAGQALAAGAMVAGGGLETVVGAALIAAGAEDLARTGGTSRWQRVAQSAVVAGGAARAGVWAAGRIGPWTGSPHPAWAGERIAMLAAEAACATSMAALGLAQRDTVLGRTAQSWWRWVSSTRTPNEIGPVKLGHRLGMFGAPVYWTGLDRYRHFIAVGGTGVGKTSRLLAPIALQDLLRMAAGEQIGLTVFEPKGEFAAQVARAAKEFGIPTIHVDPSRPDTDVWNPLDGDKDKVAESVRSVLNIMFGKQDPFFGAVQGQATVSTILLLKSLFGDKATLLDVQRHLLNVKKLQASVDQYGAKFRGPDGERDLTEEYFRGDVLANDKWTQHITGLKTQLQSLLTHERLRRVLCSPSSFSLDEHLAHGRQVLCVGTDIGNLGPTLGKLFGKLLLLSFQNAIFRRPGTENTRIPHVLIVDEAPVFLTDSIADLLSMGRSYRISVVLAMQNQSQLDLSSQGLGGQAFADTVRSNCATKLVFGTATSAEDAFWVTSQYGADTITEQTIHQDSTGRRSVGSRQVEKARVRPTQVIEQKPGRAFLQLLRNEAIEVHEIMTERVKWPWQPGGAKPTRLVDAAPRVDMRKFAEAAQGAGQKKDGSDATPAGEPVPESTNLKNDVALLPGSAEAMPATSTPVSAPAETDRTPSSTRHAMRSLSAESPAVNVPAEQAPRKTVSL